MNGPEGSDEQERDPPPAEQAGVLGNLPKTRPQVRSPRRKGRVQSAAGAGQPASDATRPKPPPRSPEPEPEAPTASGPRRATSEPAGPPDLEAIARSGLQIAGEAAALGLRIAGRAAAAIRDSVERR